MEGKLKDTSKVTQTQKSLTFLQILLTWCSFLSTISLTETCNLSSSSLSKSPLFYRSKTVFFILNLNAIGLRKSDSMKEQQHEQNQYKEVWEGLGWLSTYPTGTWVLSEPQHGCNLSDRILSNPASQAVLVFFPEGPVRENLILRSLRRGLSRNLCWTQDI